MELLKTHIDSSCMFTQFEVEVIEKCFLKKNYKKNEIILREGQYCKNLFFVESGILRAYYLKEGREVTDWFGTEGTFLTSIYAFYNELPSKQFIHAVEKSTVYSISKSDLDKLSHEYPSVEKWFRAITTEHLIRLQERITALQFYSAKERFALLREKNPKVLQKAPVSHIASYLGISLETLSRVRGG